MTGTSTAAKAFRLVLTLMMTMVWCDVGGYRAAAIAQDMVASGKPTNWKLVARTLDSVFDAAEACHRDVNRESFDPAAIVVKVGKDPVKLFTWVRDNTYWAPYRGALRGAPGVLMDRLGNSLDRSLLLAELLRAAGARCRLAHAALPREMAAELAGKVRPMPKELVCGSLIEGDQPDMDKYLKDPRLAQLAKLKQQEQSAQVDKLAEELAERLEEQSATLLEAVGRPERAAATNASAALEDHWWVQQAQGDGWVDLDVLLPDAAPGQAHAKAEDVIDLPEPMKLPKDAKLCHEVTLRIVIEQFKGGKLAEKKVLEHVVRPAEVLREHVMIIHVPLDWPKDDDVLGAAKGEQALRDNIAKQKEWLPVIRVGAEAFAGPSFDADGEINEKPQLDPAGRLGKGAVGTLGGMGGMLAGGEEPQSSGLLTAEWIEYEVRAPGAPVQRIRREVFDLVGTAARAANKAPAKPSAQASLRRNLALTNQVEVLLMPAAFSRELAMDRVLTNLEVLRAPMVGLMKELSIQTELKRTGQGKKTDGFRMSPWLTKLEPSSGRTLGFALGRGIFSPMKSELFIDQVNIATCWQGLSQNEKGDLVEAERFDIVLNRLAPTGAGDAFAAAIRQGVLDTSIESLLFAGGNTRGNASDAYKTDLGRGDKWVVLRAPRDADALTMSDNVRSRMKAELSQGMVVVAPAQPPAGRSPAWWRIDPLTGSTLGFDESGHGGAFTEYSELIGGGIVLGVISGKVFLRTKRCMEKWQKDIDHFQNSRYGPKDAQHEASDRAAAENADREQVKCLGLAALELGAEICKKVPILGDLLTVGKEGVEVAEDGAEGAK